MPPVINAEKCNGCGICVENCPMDILSFPSGNDVPHVSYPEECWHCNACKLDCPGEAIELRLPLPAMMLYVESPTKRA